MAGKQGNYKVGFGCPPIETRFKKGTSGNPKGRPKITPTIDDLFAREFEKTVLVQTDNGPKRITKAELLVQQHTNLAIKGQPKLLREALDILDRLRKKVAKERAAANTPRISREEIRAMSESERIELYQKLVRQSRGNQTDDEDHL